VDLHALLPAGFSSSVARGIWSDGRTTSIVGYGYNTLTERDEALLWVFRCHPDCNGDGALDLFDFLCFVNLFNAADGFADCDGNDHLDLFDFLCYVNAFNNGCK
jgi:hypothetical protein